MPVARAMDRRPAPERVARNELSRALVLAALIGEGKAAAGRKLLDIVPFPSSVPSSGTLETLPNIRLPEVPVY